MPSVYRRLLGPALDALPPALRRFHDVETEWTGQARFKVTRGKGWLRNLLAWCGGFPPAGDDVPLRLRIVAEGQSERWIRHFGKHRMESVQWAWRGLMLESFGAMILGFRVTVEPPALKLHPARTWLLGGLPWPTALAPHGTGIEVGQDDGFAIVARAEAPLLGMVAQYEGLVIED
jgi:hypothetical protein